MASYEDLVRAIDFMANEDEQEPLHIDGQAAVGAKAFVGLIERFEVPCPKLFSHGGDAVTFVWEGLGRKQYVTPIDGVASLYAPSASGPREDSLRYNLEDPSALADLMQQLGGRT